MLHLRGLWSPITGLCEQRRRSPSPLTCFECNGKGHVARECSNRLRRRKETVRTRHKHQYRSSSDNSSADSDSDDSRIRRRNYRHSPRRSHHRHGNYQDSRRSPRVSSMVITFYVVFLLDDKRNYVPYQWTQETVRRFYC